jgi:diadenosine tetraphosphate (Ap4A) HIT family hydrolase
VRILPDRKWRSPVGDIHEDDQVIGLMDICPIRPGHAQIIPREHFAYFEDLPDAIASRIIHLGQRLSRHDGTLRRAACGLPVHR